MDYPKILSERILALRKEKNLTQEALAEQLGLSFQAVSKWENKQSCPDIALLPVLADIFGVSVDSLFGRQTATTNQQAVSEPVFDYCDKLPWPDDKTLRGVVAWGHKILGYEKKRFRRIDVKTHEFSWLLRYAPMNVECACNLQVEGDIHGDANAGMGIKCGNIAGDAAAGMSIKCNSIKGDASAGISVVVKGE